MTERPTPDLTILETRVYRGANVWSYEPGDPPRRRPRLAGGLPDQHAPRLHRQPARRCCPGCASTPARAAAAAASSSGSTRAPGSATSPSTCALALQQEVGHDIRRGKTRQVKGAAGPLQRHLRVRRRAGRPGRRAARRTPGQPPRPGRPGASTGTSELEAFILRAERTAFGPSTQAILDEAVSRDIPWIRLNQHSLVQLGQGVHAKRIRATMTSETASIAVDIASDKDLTTRLLGAAGLPVPRQESVRTRRPGRRGRRPDRLPRRRASRSTATTAAASASTCRTRTTCARRSRSPRSSRGAAG